MKVYRTVQFIVLKYAHTVAVKNVESQILQEMSLLGIRLVRLEMCILIYLMNTY